MKPKNRLVRVLIIDEDSTTYEMLRSSLDSTRFDIIETVLGPLAIEAIRRNSPDVIIFDLISPGINVQRMCDSIREFSPVPILVLTPFSKPDAVAQTLDSGADDLLPKPVPPSLLTAHLNRLARRARDEKEAAAAKKTSCDFLTP